MKQLTKLCQQKVGAQDIEDNDERKFGLPAILIFADLHVEDVREDNEGCQVNHEWDEEEYCCIFLDYRPLIVYDGHDDVILKHVYSLDSCKFVKEFIIIFS
jgi:hypothetical protein